MPTELRMPKLGESVVEGTISKWLKKEGDTIEEYEPLLEISTDKVDTEIPSPSSGVILNIMIPEGETVSVDTLLCLIGQPGDVANASHVSQPQVVAVAAEDGNGQSKTIAKTKKSAKKAKGPHITPVVAKIAAEHGIDVTVLSGSGTRGRVTKKDILAYIEQQKTEEAMPVAPSISAAPMPWDEPVSGDLFSPTEAVFAKASASQMAMETPIPVSTPPAPPTTATPPPKPITPLPASSASPSQIIPFVGMRKSIADHMVRSKQISPHVTSVMEIDCSNMVAYYNRHKEEFQHRVGLKLTFTPIFISALVQGLRAVPIVNSVLTQRGIELQSQINIGMAVALDDGLIVPVIKNADNFNITGLQRVVTDLANRARNKQLAPDDVQGGTFTISNHGVSGSLFATPIINQPQVGILGIGKIEKRVVVITQNGVDTIAIKPMCYFSFTFDHRILDGATADKFLSMVKHTIETWQ